LVLASLPWFSFFFAYVYKFLHSIIFDSLQKYLAFQDLVLEISVRAVFFRYLTKLLFCLPMADQIDPLQDLLCFLRSPYSGDQRAQQALYMGCHGNSYVVSFNRQVTTSSFGRSISPYHMTSLMNIYQSVVNLNSR
jgi:hypothetical protein